MAAARKSETAAENQTTVELRTDRLTVITRTFNAPPRIVFDAWTRPELVKRWWTPASHNVATVSCDADVRPGGQYRYVMRVDDGPELAFSGTYTEVTPFSRLVYTQIYEPAREAGEVVVTVTFEEHDGMTRLVAHELWPSKEARDAAMATGMEDGMRETLNQLDELVAQLA